MSTISLTADNFADTIKENEIVVVDFWADWCGPCHRFAPTFDASSEKNPDVVHGKVDTEAEAGLAGAAQISSIPTLMVFKKGTLVFRESGALPAQALEQVLDAARAHEVTPSAE
ncbi:thioredoxin [Actinoalloteichus hymeniacidonis]|uniref:Thioredoxin n=1 Tax=Actinoalloteichus hymeniacidonis TaxID=340345 RepID=A0AAC9HQY7_9PSEU|nr:thioredoxin [Actinoalloteichus hymeniacidonis]AOS63919.1 thioredoxin [Actinoalloteichus hymeniacidonis]MBB5908025.1 thioredoxin [Actinoalloteichus hymeniacidonis]